MMGRQPASRLSLRSLALRARDALFERTRLVVSLFALAIGLLIWPGLGLRAPLYEIGQVAPRTVRAASDLTYEDAAATEMRRREAVELVPDVYDFDAQARERVRSQIARAFEFGRAAFESGTAGDPEFSETFAVTLGSEVTALEMQLLVELEFAEEVEQSLADTVASLLARDILRQKGALAALGRPIQRHDAESGQSTVLVDYSNALSLEEAREAARLQILALSDLSRTRRQALAEFGASLLMPTLERDEVETLHLRSEAERTVDPVVIQVRRGRTIVRAGDEVTELAHRQLQEMRAPEVGASGWAGGGAMVFALVLVLLLQTLLIPARTVRRWQVLAFVMAGTVIVLHLGLTRILGFLGRAVAAQMVSEPFSDPSVYVWVVPFASAALLMVILENQPSAVVTQTLFATALALMTGNLTLGLFALMTGFAAIFFYQRSERRAQLLGVGALVGLTGAGLIIAMELVRGGFEGVPRLSLEAASAFFAGLLSAPLVILLLPLFEVLFERTSEMRLMELSQRDNYALRQLALSAPGTYQHSVTVGMLSETAANEIGANGAFCATAALYHDIGKLHRAGYFVENTRGETPHDQLAPEKSADIIRKHVTEGVETAERLNLPKDIVDVIPQHHGTRIIRVFYEKAKAAAAENGHPVDESCFRYDGPKPQTREAAIIMIADSVEAAARSLKDPTRSEFEQVIDRISEAIVQDDQLTECDLTLSDMDRIRRSFLATLEGVHHERLPYPGFDFRKRPRG